MPELPEVETVMRGLMPAFEGRKIVAAQAHAPKLRIDIPDDFSNVMTGSTIERMYRRSKYILMDVTGGKTALLHLGMSGRVTIHPDSGFSFPRQKHDHLEFLTDAGTLVRYNDPRRFGMFTFMDTDKVGEHPLIINIGPEPLSNAFHDGILKTAFKNKKTAIKTALLDQRIVAGLGNIYVCEVLFRAGIHPEKQAGKLTGKQCEALVPIIRDVLCEAIASGGSTLKDYAQTDGSLGYFQHRFKTYGREGELCSNPDCGDKIKRITQAGRSTFYCPSCQKKR